MNVADIAAQIHADMCNDNRNGYSWEPRWGGDSPSGSKTLSIGGRSYTYKLGSYDCSSSVITAWKLALQHTAYAGVLNGASYTGDMREVFLASGLFWADRTPARRGDVYLNDSRHTAMCQDGGSDGVYGYDAMSQFSINENGQVYGGKVGDQTGREAYICAFREYPWSTTLHYNGKADTGDTSVPQKVAVVEKPQNNRDGGALAADGSAGYNTVIDWQHQMGTTEDGVISGQYVGNAKYMPAVIAVKWDGGGSQLVTAIQRKVGAGPDGLWGWETSGKIQEFLVKNGYGVGACGVDHCFGSDSAKALQRSLNDGKIWKA